MVGKRQAEGRDARGAQKAAEPVVGRSPGVPVGKDHGGAVTAAIFWKDIESLIEKILEIMSTRNNRANYYVYDAFQPADYADTAEYAKAAHARFLEWEERHQG